MKIMLVVAGALVLIVVLVVAIGYLLPRHHVATRAAVYHATPDQLYVYVAGPQNWRPDVLHSEFGNGPNGQRILRESTRDGSNMTSTAPSTAPICGCASSAKICPSTAPGPTP